MRDSLFVLLYSDLHGSLIGTPDDGAEVSDAQTVADELDVFMALLLDERRGDIAGGGNDGVARDLDGGAVLCRADNGAVFDLVLVSQERFKKTESVFFRRSKRKSCTAVANSLKTFSLAAGSFNNPPASGTAPAEARCTRPASGPSLRASAGRSPACACPVRPPEAFRSGCAPYSAESPCRGN